MKKILTVGAIGQILCGAAAYGAAIDSNGTGGGSWSSTGTWARGGIPTNGNFAIEEGNTVTASGVTIDDTANNPSIQGTLALTSSSNYTFYEINDAIASTGTLNVTNSSLGASYINPTSGSFAIDVNNGGSVILQRDATSFVTITVSSGGYFQEATFSSGTPINLEGGTVVVPFGVFVSWTGGTYVTNTQANFSVTYAQPISNYLSTNPADVLNLSNVSTPQTLTLYNTNKFNPTGGTIQMNVYGAATNDNDLLTYTGTDDFYSMSSGVMLDIAGMGDLPGAPTDYLGISYQLFSDTGNYANLDPTISPAIWEIGGTEYSVTFADTINSNGQVTVTDLTPVPEPAALGVLSLASVLCLRRRRFA